MYDSYFLDLCVMFTAHAKRWKVVEIVIKYMYLYYLFCLWSKLSQWQVPSWLYGSWIYNYLCNQCLSPLTLSVRIQLWRCALATTLCDKVCQWLATGLWFSPGTLVSSTNKTDLHDITEILLNTMTLTLSMAPPVFDLFIHI